jgi:hypothetical protein
VYDLRNAPFWCQIEGEIVPHREWLYSALMIDAGLVKSAQIGRIHEAGCVKLVLRGIRKKK